MKCKTVGDRPIAKSQNAKPVRVTAGPLADSQNTEKKGLILGLLCEVDDIAKNIAKIVEIMK